MKQLLIWLLVGLVSGWSIRLATRSRLHYGIIGDVTTGILGASLGGWLLRKAGMFEPDDLAGHVITAMLGAFVLISALHLLLKLLPARVDTALQSRVSAADFEARVRQSTDFERGLITRYLRRAPTSMDPDQALEMELTFGQRVADKVASFGGSWTFIGWFLVTLVGWMALNEDLGKPFDPYPFILLNLILSCLAAIQAPVILMSQNRQATRDRLEARRDYETNLRAELEIMALHAKKIGRAHV